MHVFYQPELGTGHIFLSEEESKHCVRVLRLQKGDQVHLTDGKGTHAVAYIVDDNPKKCELGIRSTTAEPHNSFIRLHIAIAPTKNFDRMEWFIEKATEVGISEISFVQCEHSERNRVNMERCEKTAVAAMKQSKQWWLPEVNNLVSLRHFLNEQHDGEKLIAWCEADNTFTLHKAIQASAKARTGQITVLIGPEGDFSEAEVAMAKAAGFVPVSLGKNILRTETAALYACISAHALLQA